MHKPETEWSLKFLKQMIKKYGIKTQTVLEFGAGIGRVSTSVLKHVFDSVDTVE